MVSETVKRVIDAEELQKQKEANAINNAEKIIEEAEIKAKSIIDGAYKKAKEFEKNKIAEADKQISEQKTVIFKSTEKQIELLNKCVGKNKEAAVKSVLNIILNKV